MIWILAVGALAVIALVVFALLVTGVQSSDRHKSLLNTTDKNVARSIARRVLGVYVRQPAEAPHRDDVRK